MKPDIRCFRVLVALSFSEMPAESTWANCADIALLPLLWQILKPTNAIDGIFKLNLECAQASVCLHLSVRPHFSSCWFFLAVKHMIILDLLTWFKQILHVFVLDSVPAVIKLIKLKTSADFLGSSLHWKWQEVNGLLASHRRLRVSQTQLKVQQSFWLDSQLRAQHLHQRWVVFLRLRKGHKAQRSIFKTHVRDVSWKYAVYL